MGVKYLLHQTKDSELLKVGEFAGFVLLNYDDDPRCVTIQERIEKK